MSEIDPLSPTPDELFASMKSAGELLGLPMDEGAGLAFMAGWGLGAATQRTRIERVRHVTLKQRIGIGVALALGLFPFAALAWSVTHCR